MGDFERHLTPTASGKLWLLAALFTVLLPHLIRLPPVLSLAAVAVFTWRLAHELKGWPLPRRALRWLLTLFAFATVAVLFKTVVGRDAGVALLTIMLCLKLLELYTLRDAMVTLYLGYFLVIGAFLFDQSPYTGVYLLLVVLLLTAALIALNHPQTERSHSRHYLRLAGQMLLQAFPIMVALFLLFPRLNAPLWSMPQGTVGKTGLSDQIRMGTISSLVESQEVAFRVEFVGDIPPADQLYWRGPVLWQTDGRQWTRLRQRPIRSLPTQNAMSTTVSYTVTLEPSGNHWLFALDHPSSMPKGLEGDSYVLPDYQLLADKAITRKQRYQIRSSLDYADTLFDDRNVRVALQLPQHANPKSVALAEGWVGEGLSHPQIVNRALTYYRENDFFYSRKPPLLGDNPVDDFLFNTRRGFCEHYATSFVTLMRAAGIPARVVTGYQGGEINSLASYLIVRQSSAHAWAEVWLDERGWVRIDPTTTIPQARVEETVDSQRFSSTDLLATVSNGGRFSFFARTFFQLRQMWDAVNYGWNMWILGFDREQQEKLLRALGIKELNGQKLILLLIGTLFSLITLITAFILWRRQPSHDPIQRHYLEFCNKLARRGTTRQGHEGPADFSHRACLEQPGICEVINAVTQLYIALRYQQLCDAGDVKRLATLVKRL